MKLAFLILKQNNICFHPELENLRSSQKTSLIEFDNFSDDKLLLLVKSAIQESQKIDSLFVLSEDKDLPLGKIIALLSFMVSNKIEITEMKMIGEHLVLQKMMQTILK